MVFKFFLLFFHNCLLAQNLDHLPLRKFNDVDFVFKIGNFVNQVLFLFPFSKSKLDDNFARTSVTWTWIANRPMQSFKPFSLRQLNKFVIKILLFEDHLPICDWSWNELEDYNCQYWFVICCYLTISVNKENKTQNRCLVSFSN